MQKNWHDCYDAEFENLKGKILTEITGSVGDEEMLFKTSDLETYRLKYYNDCCANRSIEDICGDLKDLIGCPILLAKEVHSSDNPRGIKIPAYQDSFTWTFYKLSTIKGSVTIRWYGSSNGYYSETATFEQIAE